MHENVLNITNHQENANQNHSELSLHTCQGGYYQKIRDNKCKWGYEEKGNLVHCWWENIATMGTMWSFLNKLKIELPYDLVIPFLGITSKGKKPLSQKALLQFSLLHYLQ